MTDEDYEKIYEECQCAGTDSNGGAGSIADFTPEHMRGLFTTGVLDGGKISTEKKDPMYTGTGLVYAKQKKEKMSEIFSKIYQDSKL